MDIKIFNTIDEIDSLLWDSLCSSNEIIKTHNFLRAVEHSNLKSCRYWYILFYKNGKPIANAALFSMDFCLDVVAPSFIKNICENIRKALPNFFKVKLVGCGTPVATCANGIALSSEASFEEVIFLLKQTVERIAWKEKAHCILFKEYNQKEVESFDLLKNFGFMRLPSLPTSFVDVSWPSFDEYIKNLRKKYRLLAKNEIKKLDGVSIEICEDFESYDKELWALYMNVYEKAEVKFEQLTPEFFKNISTMLKDKSRAILIKRDGRVVAFELIIEDDSMLRPLYLGINYEESKTYSLYFNSIYQILKHGIEREKKVVELGQTSYYPKLKVGARVEPLYLYMKFKRKPVQTLLKLPLKMLFPERDYQPMNIFNKQPQPFLNAEGFND